MVTTPFPVPVAPPVIDIQPRSDAAVQVHRLAVATVTELEPPEAPNERDGGERLYVHGAGVGSVGELLSHADKLNPTMMSSTNVV
jgi:hypothetical protein